MRKFLFVATNEWQWGGSEILWSQAAERLAGQGAEVRVSIFAAGKPREPMDRVRAAGGKVFYRQPFALGGRIARKFLPLREYSHQHVRSVGKGADVVVICQSSFWEVLPWIEAVRAARLDYVLVVQGAAASLWPEDGSAERLAPGYEGSLGAYFVSQATMDLCKRQLGVPLRHGRVIRNPFNVRYDANPPWPVDSQGGLDLACVARVEVGTKGQDVLIEAMGLPHWRERAIRVSLVGSGPQERGLKRRAAELKLTNIQFTGHENDIERVWSKHHALVLPSRQEGMPLSLVEAMLCRRPCIVTDVGGNRELIRDGVNGFLAKAPTVELLDEALNRAWENRHRLREMGEQAAVDVRRWVSADPVGDFVRDLTALVDNRNRAQA